jgi:hypothetical protein
MGGFLMKKKMSIGSSDFGTLIRKDLLFVDKSLFIKEIIEDTASVVVITRPRRWGKTSNMSMLHYFFSSEVIGRKTKGLFDQLLIAKDPGNYIERYQGKYPTISLTFKDLKEMNFENALNSFRLLVNATYRQYKHILKEPDCTWDENEKSLFQKHLNNSLDQAEIGKSLLLLSELLYKHYQQSVYILIDEYDTPLNFAFSHTDYFEPMTSLMRNFLSNALKDNPYLEKGVMTGILRISKDSMLSGLNNPQIYTVLKDSRYAPYFGFTNQELNLLFENQDLAKNEEKVKEWYNGYNINGVTLYNPWSIISCLIHKAELGSYWVNTSDDSLLKQLLQSSSIETKEQFKSLVLGNTVTVNISETMRFDQLQENPDMLWNLLLSAGYLKALSSEEMEDGFYQCQLAIPNKEVLGLYRGIFLTWLAEISQTIELKRWLEQLAIGEIPQFATRIEKFLKTAASVHDYANQPEAFYHGFMLALTISLMDHYYLFSNHESGLGRPDLLIIPKDSQKHLAVILEFKHTVANQSPEVVAKQALDQINEKEYAAFISQYSHVNKITKVGMAFDGKHVRCAFVTI